MFRRKIAEPSEWLIVGLGNPGAEYRGTRHNVGFELIDFLATKYGKKITRSKHRSLYETMGLGEVPVTLVKPLTYMNLSGRSVKPWLQELNLAPDKLLVISDDIDLAVGKLRLRMKGSSGGHNGHKSVAQMVGTTDYARLKIGVGKGGDDTIDHVLGSFTSSERKIIDEALEISAKVIEVFLQEGEMVAQNELAKFKNSV